MSDIGADVLAEWRVVPEDVVQMLLRRCLEIYPIVIFLFHCAECSISKISSTFIF